MLKQNQMVNIQILRSFAAISVISFHVFQEVDAVSSSSSIFSMIAKNGYAGVDIFFVISGFILMNSQMRNPKEPFDFILRRLIRIIPMYYFVTACYCLLYAVRPVLFDNFNFSKQWLLASLTFTSGLADFGYPIVVPGWTLEFELLFYVILALTSKLVKDLNLVLIQVLIIGLLVLVGVNSVVLEFLFGVLCAFLSLRIRVLPRIAMLLLTLGSVSFLSSNLLDKLQIDRCILFGIPASLMIFGLANLKPFSNRAAIALGDSSYSIYLIQVLTIPFFFKFVDKLNFTALPPEILALTSIIFTILCGHFLFWPIEKYLNSLVYNKFRLVK